MLGLAKNMHLWNPVADIRRCSRKHAVPLEKSVKRALYGVG